MYLFEYQLSILQGIGSRFFYWFFLKVAFRGSLKFYKNINKKESEKAIY